MFPFRPYWRTRCLSPLFVNKMSISIQTESCEIRAINTLQQPISSAWCLSVCLSHGDHVCLCCSHRSSCISNLRASHHCVVVGWSWIRLMTWTWVRRWLRATCRSAALNESFCYEAWPNDACYEVCKAHCGRHTNCKYSEWRQDCQVHSQTHSPVLSFIRGFSLSG